MFAESDDTALTNDRVDRLRGEITHRLEGVCAHWPREQFDALVTLIASITFKYEGQDPHARVWQQPQERLGDRHADT